MSDPHSVSVSTHAEPLVLKANYAALLRVEEAADADGDATTWHTIYRDAITLARPSAVFRMAAILADCDIEDIVNASPPLNALHLGITKAWALANDGPEGLRKVEEDERQAAAEREAAADEGKRLNRSRGSFWTRWMGRLRLA